MKNMNDDVAGIDQHPIAVRQALNAKIMAAGGFKIVTKAIGDRTDMTLRPPGGDDHEVAKRGFSGDVD